MRINNYTDYKVKRNVRYSVRVGFDEFKEHKFDEIIDKVNGYELLELLLQGVSQYTFMSIEVKGNKIFLELFNLSTCEDSSLEFEITELRGKGNGSNE